MDENQPSTGLHRFLFLSYAFILAGLMLIGYAVLRNSSFKQQETKAQQLRFDRNYTLTIATLDLPNTLNPNEVDSGTQHLSIMPLVYDSLFTLKGSAAQLTPHLISAWSYDPTKWIYRIELRKGILFWDGSELRAENIRKNFEDWLGPRGSESNILSSLLGATEFHSGKRKDLPGVVVTGPYSFELHLERHDGHILRYLCIPRFRVTKFSNGQLIGTGPFIPKKFNPNELYLERNPKYFSGEPTVRGIRFKTMNPDEIHDALVNGEIDLTWNSISRENSNPRLYREVKSISALTALLYLNTTSKFFDTIEKRYAVFGAINLIKMNQDCELGPPTYSVLPPGLLGYDPNSTPIPYKSINKKIRWPKRPAEILFEKIGDQSECVAEHINHYFRAAGIPLHSRLVLFPEIDAAWNHHQVNAAIEPFNFLAGNEIKLFLYFSRKNHEFLIGANSDDYQALIDFTKQRSSMDSQGELLRELDVTTRRNGYVLPLWNPQETFFVRRDIHKAETLLYRSPDWDEIGKVL